VEVSKTFRGVLVTASIFEIMLASNKAIGREKPRVIGGHILGPVVRVSALDTVEDITTSRFGSPDLLRDPDVLQ
jgi:hypothetical protein